MTGIAFNLDSVRIRPGDTCEVVQMRRDDPLAVQVLGKKVVVKEFKVINGRGYWLLEEPLHALVNEDNFVSGRDTPNNVFALPKGSTMTINAIPAAYLSKCEPEKKARVFVPGEAK